MLKEIEYFATQYGLNSDEVKKSIDLISKKNIDSEEKEIAIKKLVEDFRDKAALNFYNKVKDTVQKGKIVQNIKDDDEHILLNGWPEELILPKYEKIKGETFSHNDEVFVYIVPFKSDEKKIRKIICSRTHPMFLEKLIEYYVPEIGQKKIEIVNIVREPGDRAKVAVKTLDSDIDAITVIIGKKLVRINQIRKQINHEQIDLIKYSDDDLEYVKNALSPARIIRVEHLGDDKYKAFVENYQLSLAIGKNAQNVRLAVRLTGKKIDISVGEI